MARPLTVSNEEILEIARSCFLEHGPGVSTTVIAEQVGLSQASLFKRFGTKKSLMMAALRPPDSLPWMPILEAGPGPEPLSEQLVSIGVLMSTFLRQLVPCLSILRASGVDQRGLLDRFEGPPPPVLTVRALQAWFERAQAQGLLRPMDGLSTRSPTYATRHAALV